LAPLLLEDDDLVVALLLQHLGGHGCAGDGRAARFGRTVAAQQQNLAQLDDIAGLAGDLLNLDNVFRRHAILLAARANDREHLFQSVSWGLICQHNFVGPARL
jgi:hypothetical protein